jgi:hypothetical protein
VLVDPILNLLLRNECAGTLVNPLKSLSPLEEPVFDERQNQFSRFSGVIQLETSPVEPSAIVDELGEPYWRDHDEDGITWFFEFPSHELQIEHSIGGQHSNIVVTKDALMADAEQRQSYGVDKLWPPF